MDKNSESKKAVRNLGGAGADAPPPQGFEPLPTQRAPFVLFWDIQFWLTDLEIFPKAPLAPIYTNFEGGARAEKTQFYGQNFPQKVPKI